MEGYMQKRGKPGLLSSGFRRRWFYTVQDSTKAVFLTWSKERHTAADAKGSVRLQRVGEVKAPYTVDRHPTDARGGSEHLQWALQTADRRYIFRCTSEKDKFAWIEYLEHLYDDVEVTDVVVNAVEPELDAGPVPEDEEKKAAPPAIQTDNLAGDDEAAGDAAAAPPLSPAAADTLRPAEGERRRKSSMVTSAPMVEAAEVDDPNEPDAAPEPESESSGGGGGKAALLAAAAVGAGAAAVAVAAGGKDEAKAEPEPEPEPEAEAEAASEAGTDYGSDAGTDYGSDAGTDYGSDAGTDYGSASDDDNDGGNDGYAGMDDDFDAFDPDAPAEDDVKEEEVDPADEVSLVSAIDQAELERMLALKRDWNGEYQDLLDRLEAAAPGEERKRVVLELYALVDEFEHVAGTLGRIVISETTLPFELKTIKPVDVGGVAGGEKFISSGLFMKRVSDDAGIYGCDEMAMKAAKHELLGARAYAKLQYEAPGVPLPGHSPEARAGDLKEARKLRTALVANVDFRGYRVLAQCLLPVGKGTLGYGSADGGKSVQKRDRIAPLMAAAGRLLHLKPHVVGATPAVQTELVGPCDIEVHESESDDRLYVLDTARVWAPQRPPSIAWGTVIPADPEAGLGPANLRLKPKELAVASLTAALGVPTEFPLRVARLVTGELIASTGRAEDAANERASRLVGHEVRGDAVFVPMSKGEHLYKMFRAELVLTHSVPLSSDIYCGFGRHNAAEHHAEALEAQRVLVQERVYTLSDDITGNRVLFTSGAQLRDIMHARGINMRYMGVVRRRLAHHCVRAKTLLLTEMISRVVKNLLRYRMRSLGEVLDSGYVPLCVAVFNSVFGKGEQAEFFWKTHAPVSVRQRYGHVWTETERWMAEKAGSAHTMRAFTDPVLLFRSLQAATGVRFKLSVNRRFSKDPLSFMSERPFRPCDLLTIRPVTVRIAWMPEDTLRELEDDSAVPAAQMDEAQRRRHGEMVERFGDAGPAAVRSHLRLARYFFLRSQGLAPAEAAAAPVARLVHGGAEGDALDAAARSMLGEAETHAERAWEVTSTTLDASDARILVIFLRGRVQEALGEYHGAIEHYQACTRAVTTAYGTAVDHNQMGKKGAGHGETTMVTSKRGHPFLLLAVERMLHCAAAHKAALGDDADDLSARGVGMEWTKKAFDTMQSHMPPSVLSFEPENLERAFGRRDPLVFEAIRKQIYGTWDMPKMIDYFKGRRDIGDKKKNDADAALATSQLESWLAEAHRPAVLEEALRTAPFVPEYALAPAADAAGEDDEAFEGNADEYDTGRARKLAVKKLAPDAGPYKEVEALKRSKKMRGKPTGGFMWAFEVGTYVKRTTNIKTIVATFESEMKSELTLVLADKTKDSYTQITDNAGTFSEYTSSVTAEIEAGKKLGDKREEEITLTTGHTVPVDVYEINTVTETEQYKSTMGMKNYYPRGGHPLDYWMALHSELMSVTKMANGYEQVTDQVRQVVGEKDVQIGDKTVRCYELLEMTSAGQIESDINAPSLYSGDVLGGVVRSVTVVNQGPNMKVYTTTEVTEIGVLSKKELKEFKAKAKK